MADKVLSKIRQGGDNYIFRDQNAVHSVTASTNGKVSVDGTDVTAYTHPTSAGNKHVPSGGSSGQFLGWDSAGTAKWVNNPASGKADAATTLSGYGITDAYTKTETDTLLNGKVQVVASLPASGSTGTVYYVGPSGSGADQYEEYIWDATNSQFIKVGEKSVDLSDYLKKNGDGKDVTVTFTQAGSKANINSAESLATMFGKIKKWYASMGDLAWKSNVSDSDISGTISDTHIASASTWNAKQDALATQTAYTSKGTATKVPQITTNSLGQVTGITEVTISGVTPASHTHGNISNTGTLTDTAAAAAGNDYVVIRDADNAKVQTSTIKGMDVADAVSKKHAHSNITLSTTAQAYDGTHTIALPSSDPYTSARTPSSHTHGNIQNGGTLQTNDVTIASGDQLVVTDSSDSNKVARASVSFDGTTTTTALTPKGTFEAFAKSGDITSAINALDVSSVGGSGKYISAISETDGKISATATTMDTAPTTGSTNAVTSGGVYTALDGKVDVAGDTMTGRLTLQKTLSQIVTGAGTAATSSTSGGTTTYYPAKWTYDLGIATPNAGDQMVIQLPCAGHDYGVYISTDNGTTYYPVAHGTGSSRCTTRYPAGAYICVVFEAFTSGNNNAGRVVDVYPAAGGTSRTTLNSGCWRIVNDYDSGNNYDRLCNASGRFYAGATGCSSYSIVCLDITGKYSKLISSGTGTGNTKTVNTSGKFVFPSVVLYYSGDNTVSANTLVTSTYATYSAYPVVDIRYSTNYNTTSNPAFTTNSPVYIECNINDDGTWSPTEKAITQTLTTGKYYIYLGISYSTAYQLSLSTIHPVLYYDGTNLVSALLTKANITASSTNGSINVAGTDVTVYTHPTTEGNKHIPSGGSSGQYLAWDSAGTAKWVSNPNSDTKVKATAKTDNVNYKILATASASPTSGNATEAVYDTDITLNPSTNTIAANISGDAATASAAKSGSALETAINGKAASNHTHGNISNTGTLTDTAAAAAGNDYVVIRDADNAKIQTSTIKGTDVADAVSKKHSHSTLTLSTTAQAYDGTHTLALPSTDPYTSARTPASHTHGNIANGGTLTDTAAAAAGNDYVVIRDADNSKIQTSTIKGTDVADAVSKKHEHSTLTLSTTAQAYDGTHTLALPASDPYTSARTPASHTHGNITNAGGITASGVTIANGDSLAIVDSSETNKLIAKSSVTFDGSTTTKALTQKGTFETFLKSHQDISGKEDTSNKVSSWSSTTTDTHYPSEKLVKDSLDEKADKAEGVYYVVGTHQFTAYSASATYTVWTSGAYTASNSCLRDNYAYYCKTAISTPEAWNSSHWTKIATVEWQGAITGLTALYAGLKIAYKVPCYGGSSSTTLNINNLGAKTVMRNVSNTTTHLPTGSVVFLAYDGTYWRWADYDSDTTYTVQAYTSTGASTAAKAATAYGFVYTAGETFLVRFGNGNTYAGAITLNLNSQGAKALYLNGKPTSASNYSFSAGTYPVYYDGTNCYMWTDGTFEHKHVKAVSYKGLEYTTGENLVYQYVSGGSSNCTYPADHSYVTIAPDNRDTYFGIKFAEDVAADEIISAAFDVEYTGDDDGQFKWEFKAIGQQGGIKIAITGAGHYTAYGVAGLAVSKGTLQNAAFDDLGRTLPANSLKIKNFKFERGATATGFCLCKDETSIGHAETADKINTSVKIGDTNQPVYVAADGTVTPISYTIATSVPANAVFTDTKVKATAKTDNVNYKILATASASPTSGNATEAVYDTDITLNPSTNTIAASISGNAATATSAGKLTTARKTYVTLGTASTTTTRDWSGDTTIPVDGTLGVGNGGTGKSSVTSNSFLVGNGSSAMVEKTPAQVLSLIGAQATITYMTTDQENSIITELGDL